MDTPKKSKLGKEEIILLIIQYTVLLIGLLFAFIGLSEFYNVRLEGHESEYAFGYVNENRWYYQNATIYSTYNFVSGILFVSALIISLGGIIKKNKKTILVGVGMTVILLIATVVSSGIQLG